MLSKLALYSNIIPYTQTKTTKINKTKIKLKQDSGIYNGFHKTNTCNSKIH